MFISEPVKGLYYIAELSKKGRRTYLWSTMPVEPTDGPVRIDNEEVPKWIRMQAFRQFKQDKERQAREVRIRKSEIDTGWLKERIA